MEKSKIINSLNYIIKNKGDCASSNCDNCFLANECNIILKKYHHDNSTMNDRYKAMLKDRYLLAIKKLKKFNLITKWQELFPNKAAQR